MQPSSLAKRLPDRPIFTSLPSSSKPTASPVTPRTPGLSHAQSPLPPPLCPPASVSIDASTPLTMSKAEWPKDAHVKWKVFELDPTSEFSDRDAEDVMEDARRKVASEWEGDMWDGLVGALRTNSRNRTWQLWVFEVGDSRKGGNLAQAHYPDLREGSSGSFHPTSLYPCPLCIDAPSRCDKCAVEDAAPPRVSQLLPRECYRIAISMFLAAMREKILDLTSKSFRACRLRDGLLLTPAEIKSSRWENGWRQDDSHRFLLQAYIQLSLQHTHLLIEPLIRSSPHLPFPTSEAERPPPGTALTLLPHGHPAFYLASCHNPPAWSSFEPYIRGRGASDWRKDEGQTGWLQCWVKTPAKNGVDYGVEIVWPTNLVVLDVSRGKMFPLPGMQPPALSGAEHAGSAVAESSASAEHLAEPQHGALRDTLAPPPPKLSSEKGLVLTEAATLGLFTEDAVKERERARAGKEKEKKDREDKEKKDREELQKSTSGDAPDVVQERLDLTRKHDIQMASPSHPQPSSIMSGSPGVSIAVPNEEPAVVQSHARERASPARLPSLAVSSPIVSDTTNRWREQDTASGTRSTNGQPAFRTSLSVPVTTHQSPESSLSPDVPLQEAIEQQRRGSLVTESSDNQAAEEPQGDQPDDVDLFSEGDDMDNMDSMDWGGLMEGPYDHQPNEPFDHLLVPPMQGSSGSIHPALGQSPAFHAVHNVVSAEDGYGQITDDDFAFFDKPHDVPPNSVETTANATTLPDLPALPPLMSPEDSPMLDPVQTRAASPISKGATPVAAHSMGLPRDDANLPEAVDLTTSPSPSDTMPLYDIEPVATPSVLEPHLLPFMDLFQPLDLDFPKDPKYTVGKFALLQDTFDVPPVEDDVEDCFFSWDELKPAWYKVASDPRVGMVKRLQGLKRDRSTAFPDLTKEDYPKKRMRKSWVDVLDVKRIAEDKRQRASSGESSDDDEDETIVVDEEDIEGMTDYMTESEPSPAPLPPPTSLFPTSGILLCSPSTIAETCRPLHTPPPAAAAAPISALTPVSPATWTQTQDASFAMESAANILCGQAVDDPLLAEFLAHPPPRPHWQSSEIMSLAADTLQLELMKAVPLQIPLTLGDVTGTSGVWTVQSSSHQIAKKPQFEEAGVVVYGTTEVAVGLGGAVINVSTPALRFWEKLGLEPVGGRKDVVAYVLYESAGDETDDIVTHWLSRVGQTYMAKGFGRHQMGALEAKNGRGLVPVQWDFLLSKLGVIIKALTHDTPHVVFYLLVRRSQANITSSFMQLLAPTINKQADLAGRDPMDRRSMLFHFVPDHSLLHLSHPSHSRPMAFDILVSSIYDRLLRIVDRNQTRNLYAVGPRQQRAIQFPAFVIARPTAPKIEFSLQWPPPTLDVIDRHAFLHVAYRLSSSSEWLIATCVDQLGEAHSHRVWIARQGDQQLTEAKMVAKVWSFAWKVARRARKDWRIVIARWGITSYKELEAWESLLRLTAPTLPLAVHISIVTVDPDHSIKLQAATKGEGTSDVPFVPAESATHFIDASFTTYGVFLGGRTTLLSHSVREAMQQEPSDVLDLHEEHSSTCDLAPLCTSWLFHVPAEAAFSVQADANRTSDSISTSHVHLMYYTASKLSHLVQSRLKFMHDLLRSYHHLAVLAREKWIRPKCRGALPWHFAALSLMDSILEQN